MEGAAIHLHVARRVLPAAAGATSAPPAERPGCGSAGWAHRRAGTGAGLTWTPQHTLPAASPRPRTAGQGKDLCTEPTAATAAPAPPARHRIISPALTALRLRQQQRREQRKPERPQDTLAKATGILRAALHGIATAQGAAAAPATPHLLAGGGGSVTAVGRSGCEALPVGAR